MAEYTKEELFDLLMKSPEEFSDYNKSVGDLDMSETDFSNLTLENVSFLGADLSGCCFAEATLTEVDFTDTDLTSADFSRAHLVECNFNGALLNGTEFSYSVANYCNFTDSDMAGSVFNESNLENSDFSAAENMDAVRFDESTVWPDEDMLPEDFDTSYVKDLSSLEDDEDMSSSDY